MEIAGSVQSSSNFIGIRGDGVKPKAKVGTNATAKRKAGGRILTVTAKDRRLCCIGPATGRPVQRNIEIEDVCLLQPKKSLKACAETHRQHLMISQSAAMFLIQS